MENSMTAWSLLLSGGPTLATETDNSSFEKNKIKYITRNQMKSDA